MKGRFWDSKEQDLGGYMVKLAYSVEWYLRGIIIHPVYEILFIFTALAQYGILYVLKSANNFIYISIIFLLPLFQIFIGTGIFRDTKVKVFEITLLEGYYEVMYSKALALLISYVPFIVFELVLLYHFNLISLFVPFMLSSMFAIVLSLLLSTSTKANFSTVALAIFLFIFPISFQAFLQSITQFNLHPDLVMSSLSYFLSPFIAYEYWENGVILLAPYKGFLIASAGLLVLFLLYMVVSVRKQIKP